MSLIGYVYIYAFKNFNEKYNLHTPVIFYTILIMNYLSIVAIGTMNVIQNCGAVSFLYLIVRFLKERFNISANELEILAGSEFDSKKLDEHLHIYNLIIDDLLKCDRFFSKFNFFNYYMGMAICSFTFLAGKLF